MQSAHSDSLKNPAGADHEPFSSPLSKGVLSLVLFLFTILSGLALWYHGYLGILMPLFESFGPGQVLADLVIALSLFLVWMWHDSRKTRRVFWPWFLLTLVAGSFGPLLYILTRKVSHETSNP